MLKKIIGMFFLVLLSSNVFAKEIINIYQEPRKVPYSTIYHESGKRYRLSDFQGKFLIVVFWSKTCSVCIRELDELSRFKEIVKNNGIEVILVSPSNDWNDFEHTKKFLKRYDASNFDVYWDENGELASSLGIFATPHNVLINSKGEEIGRIRGGADWDDDNIIEYIYKLKSEHM